MALSGRSLFTIPASSFERHNGAFSSPTPSRRWQHFTVGKNSETHEKKKNPWSRNSHKIHYYCRRHNYPLRRRLDSVVPFFPSLPVLSIYEDDQ
jgi:hypothetical protein